MDLRAHFDDFTERDWERPTDGTLRLALIGLGWWTREKAIPAIEDATYCETTVLVSSSAERAEAVAADVETVEAGIDYDAFHDGVASEHYDAVYVATPNALHLQYVETAADLDKAICCEKPMEASVERAEQLVETAADVPLMVAYRMHTEPAVRRLRDLLRAGFVGDPVQVHGHMSQRLPEMNPDPEQWRVDPELAGPGASVTDIGIYPLNTARFVLETDPTSVQAMLSSTDAFFSKVPDERAAFSVSFENGVVASCSASQNAHQSSHLRIVGTEGEATLEPAFFPERRRKLTLRRGDLSETITIEKVDQMREEFDYFANCVLTDRRPEGDGEHGLVDMRTIEAVYEAADRGSTIEI
jgi:xylose dehydrogenase (NAD/NADP)